MKLLFTTKSDTNGNRLSLVLNTDTKTFTKQDSLFATEPAMTISRKDMNSLLDYIIDNGYTEKD